MASVTVRSTTHYRQQVTTSSHTLVADEPMDKGGDDAGSSPTELLVAALASCTSITIQMYARRKGWPLEAVTVHATHERIPIVPRPQDPAVPPNRETIALDIQLKGDLTEEQRARIQEIARRCPVHRTLDARPEISDTVRIIKEEST
ncbi:MAG: OsmC family protein [SAR202 cluster bacterium]|nr:OsmC family protein [SAR202 cluster bacterium]